MRRNTTWKTLSEGINGGEGVAPGGGGSQDSAQAFHIGSEKLVQTTDAEDN